MQVSVIVLNYNVRYFLELCIHSVQQSLVGLDAEIIVVDNNSPDDSCTMMKARFPEIKLIENKENVGFAKAYNQAVETAKGTYICILNPDTVVAETTFVNSLEKATSLPNLGLLGVQLVDGKGVFLPESKRHVPTPKVSFFKMAGERFSHYAPYYVSNIAPKDSGEIPVLVGAFMLVKKEVYQEVGGFDEDYFMYGEDIDLSYKILQAGYQNFYEGSESVIHFKGESTFKDKTYRKRFFGAMKLFYKKHFKSSWIVNVCIYAGIKMATLLQSSSKTIQAKAIEKVILVSENDNLLTALEEKMKQSVMFVKHENDSSELVIDSQTCCFLDMNSISYFSAIQLVKKYSEAAISFRFIPKGAFFSAGSDTSNGRGEVISF